MSCEEMRPLRLRRSASSVPSCETPSRLPSTTRRNFSRVVVSWAAVCRIARSTGPISSSAHAPSISRISASPNRSTGVAQVAATPSSQRCGGSVAASSSASLDPK